MNLQPTDEVTLCSTVPIFVVVCHSHASQKIGGVGSTTTAGTALKDPDETEAVDLPSVT
jgi:hypothetical protein